MSYNFIAETRRLIEAVAFIQDEYSSYERDILECVFTKEKYSIQMIMNSIQYPNFIYDLVRIIMFDFIIGNSDRHHSNFGFLVNKDTGNNIEFAPLYDNGSSLCAYIDSEDVDNIINDKMKFESLVNTKSKSAIGWENIRPIRHLDLIEQIRNNYYDETISLVEIIKNNINAESIDNILNNFDNSIIDSKIKLLVKEFLLEKVKRLIEIYSLKGEN